MNRTEKAVVVSELTEQFAAASGIFLADYRGLTVGEVSDLRRKCREESVGYRVIKNTLAKRALAGTDKEALVASFTGPTAVAWHDEDPVIAAKVLSDYAKENDKLELKDAFVEGRTISATDVTALAKLPGKKDLQAQFLSILTAPMQNIVSILGAPMRDVVGVIDAYAKKQQEG